jgi:tripartite-type tricarboxylate transporter receptor subunit TctC
MFDRRQFLASSAAGLLAGAGIPALAQREAGRVVVGFAPGGAADAVARLLSTKLGKEDAPYIVDNRAGAGGRLAADYVKGATPDGRTMLVTPDSVMGIYPHVYKNLGYNPLTDFKAVSLLTTVPIGLAVGPMVPASVRTPADFVQWCKANPDKASYGTAGAGSPLHFLGVMFAKGNGFQYTHVPFRGGAPAAQDAMAGQIASSINVISEVAPLLQAGKLRLLAVSGSTRSRFLPDVPTFRETGFKDADFQAWFGLFLPAKTPDNVVTALHRAAADAFNSPDARESLAKLTFEVAAGTPEELAAVVKSDIARWGPVVKESGYTAQE